MNRYYKEEFSYEYWLEPHLEMQLRNAEFQDISWHNDACPSFVHELGGKDSLRLFVHPVDPNDREMPEAKRFCLSIEHEDCSILEPVETETWSEMIKLITLCEYLYRSGVLWEKAKHLAEMTRHS